MDRRAKMELFDQIRPEHAHVAGTIKGLAKKLRVHRRMAPQALASALYGRLEADRGAPRKQRHIAHRIWRRIREEKPESILAEATVRRYVQLWKEELGLKVREVFVPQSYEWGGKAQVVWYGATVELDG